MEDSVSNPCFLDRRNKVNRSIYEYTLCRYRQLTKDKIDSKLKERTNDAVKNLLNGLSAKHENTMLMNYNKITRGHNVM